MVLNLTTQMMTGLNQMPNFQKKIYTPALTLITESRGC